MDLLKEKFLMGAGPGDIPESRPDTCMNGRGRIGGWQDLCGNVQLAIGRERRARIAASRDNCRKNVRTRSAGMFIGIDATTHAAAAHVLGNLAGRSVAEIHLVFRMTVRQVGASRTPGGQRWPCTLRIICASFDRDNTQVSAVA